LVPDKKKHRVEEKESESSSSSSSSSGSDEITKEKKTGETEENDDDEDASRDKNSKAESVSALLAEYLGAPAGSSTSVAASCSNSSRVDAPRLDAPSSVDHYVNQLRVHESTWDVKTPEEKIAIFRDIINAKFATLGIPLLEINLLDSSSLRNGEFNSTEWNFSLSANKLKGPLSESASTAYHESRHAEQYYMIARRIVGNAYPAPPHNQIPEKVLAAAESNPDLSREDTLKADAFHKSVFGTDAKERNFVLTRLATYTPAVFSDKIKLYSSAKQNAFAVLEDAKKFKSENEAAYLATGKTWKEHPQGTINRQNYDTAKAQVVRAEADMNDTKSRMDSAQADYRALPEEADAFKCGDMVTARFASSSSSLSSSSSSSLNPSEATV